MSHQETLASRSLPRQLLENIGSRFHLMASNTKTEWDKSDVLLNPYVFHLSFLPVFGFLH